MAKEFDEENDRFQIIKPGKGKHVNMIGDILLFIYQIMKPMELSVY